MPDEPTILNYATPEPVTDSFARTPCYLVVLLALIVPGLSSSLIRRSPKPCLLLCPVIPVAFVFFGPFWGEVLFPQHPMSEWRNAQRIPLGQSNISQFSRVFTSSGYYHILVGRKTKPRWTCLR